MANKGKRMVFEKDIAQIGQGGGGGSYTAGNGINISEEDVISIDNTVALKTDIPANYVTTDTAQTITGQKTYTDNYFVTNNKKVTFYDNTAESYNQKVEIRANSMAYTTTGNDRYRIKVTMPVDGAPVGQNYYLPKPNGTISREIAMVDQIPAAVSGTNDGTNWTSLTVGADTYAIPQGGGSNLHLVAGTGIDITAGEVEGDKVISVDNTIATKAELNARAGKLYSYMQTPADVYNELVAEDPQTDNQDAINEWLKRMPAFVSANIDAAGMTTLEGMGFKNLVQIQPGAKYDIQGYFSIIIQGTTISQPVGMQVCMADRIGSATKQLWNIAPGPRIQHTVVIGSTEIEFENCRFREANTSLYSYADLFNMVHTLIVQQMGVNAQTDATLGMANAYGTFNGRQAETVGISVQGGIPANNQFNTQLAAPTVDGSYQLGCTVSSGVPTFAWGTGGSTPTNMMTTNSTQSTLSGNKEYQTGYHYRFGVLNSGNPWSQISDTQISNNDGAGASAYFNRGILNIIDDSTSHLVQARPDYLEYSIDGGSTGDKIYFNDLVALIAYAKSQGWIQ